MLPRERDHLRRWMGDELIAFLEDERARLNRRASELEASAKRLWLDSRDPVVLLFEEGS